MKTDQWFCFRSGERKMAESKGALIAKSVSKHAGRAKEKVIVAFKRLNKLYLIYFFHINYKYS